MNSSPRYLILSGERINIAPKYVCLLFLSYTHGFPFFDRDARRSGPTIHFDEVDPTSSLWKLKGAYKLIILDHIGLDWIKLDGSDRIRLDQIGSDWIRLDQIGSDRIRSN